MAQLGWYYSNQGRSYPFQAGELLGTVQPIELESSLNSESYSLPSSSESLASVSLASESESDGIPGAIHLPTTAVVDFGCTLGLDSGFEPDEHQVHLAEIRRWQGRLEFEFRCTAPELENWSLVFCRDIATAESAIEYGVATGPEGEAYCPDDATWEGFLVTGPLEELLLAIAEGQRQVPAEPWIVEPGLLISLRETYVRSISVANAARLRVWPSPECRDEDDPDTDPQAGLYFVNAACLTGPIRVVEGYNCSIQQNAGDNSLTIAAGVGAGAGKSCEEIELYPGESPPPGSTLLSGGPSCQQTISTINGLEGPHLQLLAGPGVSITTEDAKIIVDVDLADFANCAS